MKVSEVTRESRRIGLEATIIEKSEPREVTTRFGQTRVADALIEDETGMIKLVLWGDEVNLVNQGDKITIENGYIKEWNGTLQINVGKFGKLKVLNGSANSDVTTI